jgi:hypothetical protein
MEGGLSADLVLEAIVRKLIALDRSTLEPAAVSSTNVQAAVRYVGRVLASPMDVWRGRRLLQESYVVRHLEQRFERYQRQRDHSFYATAGRQGYKKELLQTMSSAAGKKMAQQTEPLKPRNTRGRES